MLYIEVYSLYITCNAYKSMLETCTAFTSFRIQVAYTRLLNHTYVLYTYNKLNRFIVLHDTYSKTYTPVKCETNYVTYFRGFAWHIYETYKQEHISYIIHMSYHHVPLSRSPDVWISRDLWCIGPISMCFVLYMLLYVVYACLKCVT